MECVSRQTWECYNNTGMGNPKITSNDYMTEDQLFNDIVKTALDGARPDYQEGMYEQIFGSISYALSNDWFKKQNHGTPKNRFYAECSMWNFARECFPKYGFPKSKDEYLADYHVGKADNPSIEHLMNAKFAKYALQYHIETSTLGKALGYICLADPKYGLSCDSDQKDEIRKEIDVLARPLLLQLEKGPKDNRAHARIMYAIYEYSLYNWLLQGDHIKHLLLYFGQKFVQKPWLERRLYESRPNFPYPEPYNFIASPLYTQTTYDY